MLSGPFPRLYKRPEQGRWEIVVQPVPHTLPHHVKEYILDSALAQLAQSSIQRKELSRPGNDILAVFYVSAVTAVVDLIAGSFDSFRTNRAL